MTSAKNIRLDHTGSPTTRLTGWRLPSTDNDTSSITMCLSAQSGTFSTYFVMNRSDWTMPTQLGRFVCCLEDFYYPNKYHCVR